MLRFNHEHFTVLGLTHAELERLKNGKPISFNESDLNRKFSLLFMGIADRKSLEEYLVDFYGGQSESLIIHANKRFYVVPLANPVGEMLYLIGFDEVSRTSLMAGELFRFKVIDQKPTTVYLMAGASDERLVAQLENFNAT